jgi:hypothetical protein
MSGKKWLILFLSIGGLTAIYLYYVKKERQASITTYFSNPRINDVYKMQDDYSFDRREVYYLKIKDIGKESIYFYPSYGAAGSIHDGFLNHFDTSAVKVFTKRELQEIRDGKKSLQLVEIVRK